MRLLLLSLMILILACGDDPVQPDYSKLCGIPRWFPPFKLEPETLQSFPFTPEEYRYAVFVDSVGQEHLFDIEGPKITNLYRIHDRPCEFDTSLIRSYREHSEDYGMKMTDTLLGLTVFLSFRAFGKVQDTSVIAEEDVLLLDVFEKGHSSATPTLRHQLLLKYGQSNYDPIQPRDEVTINGKPFQQVYTHEGDPFHGQYWIGYFNYAIGIVGLRSGTEGISLAFERFE